MATFEANGRAYSDGDRAVLRLRHGEQDVVNDRGVQAGHYERDLSGVIHSFEQDGELRWEILTGDPTHPEIGFLPENLLPTLGD